MLHPGNAFTLIASLIVAYWQNHSRLATTAKLTFPGMTCQPLNR